MGESTDLKTEVYHHPDVEVEVGYKPEDELVVEKLGTQRDVLDMARMGKIQQLRVRVSRSKWRTYCSLTQSATLALIRSLDSR